MMKYRVIVTGPESTGKTTLSEALGDHYNVPVVPEYARTYLDRNDGRYNQSDLLHIAKKQDELERTFSTRVEYPLICDTSMLVIKIWSSVKYNEVHPWIERACALRKNAQFILCTPDFPWQEDPLREHPEQREELFKRYRNTLEKMKARYLIVEGSPESRLEKSVIWIDDYFLND